jgi:uncharacterized membrane protein HdeD (DUF308 family)
VGERRTALDHPKADQAADRTGAENNSAAVGTGDRVHGGTQMPLRTNTDALAGNWWALALRGVAAIIFGVLAFVLPGVTLAALILLFGGYALVEGVLNVIAAVRGRGDDQPWWALLLEGLVSIAAGIVAFAVPGLTALALLYVIAAWAIVTGVLEIVAAIRLRRRIAGEAWLVLNGVLSIAFGVLTMLAPGAGALSLVWLIGAYAIVFGALLVGLSLQLRRWRGEAAVRIARAA